MANDLAKGRKVKCKPMNEHKGVQNSVSHFQAQKLSKKEKKNQSPPISLDVYVCGVRASVGACACACLVMDTCVHLCTHHTWRPKPDTECFLSSFSTLVLRQNPGLAYLGSLASQLTSGIASRSPEHCGYRWPAAPCNIMWYLNIRFLVLLLEKEVLFPLQSRKTQVCIENP